MGAGFTLLQLGPEPRDPAQLVASAASRRLPLDVLHVPQPEARALYGRALSLIRPDGHIAWRGERLPTNIDSLLDRVTGRGNAAADSRAA